MSDINTAMQQFRDFLLSQFPEPKVVEILQSLTSTERRQADVLITLAATRFGMTSEELIFGCTYESQDLRAICYIVLEKYINLSHKELAEIFHKKKPENIGNMLLKAQGYIEHPMINPVFTKRYKIISNMFLNLLDTYDHG